jgi:hypothetical protein
MSGRYRERFLTWRPCAWCREMFGASRVDAQTCGPKCRKAMSRLHSMTVQEMQRRNEAEAARETKRKQPKRS